MDDDPPFAEPYVIFPTTTHTHTVVLLHGRGSSGVEFAQELFEGESFSGRSLPQHFPGFKWIFPNAQPRFSTVFQEDLVEWFDIYSLTDPSVEEELQVDGLAESVAHIQDLVDNEVRILGPSSLERVILGGISQGCAVAVIALLTGMCGVGAFVGFNGWMSLKNHVNELLHRVPRNHNGIEAQRCGWLAAVLRRSLGLSEEAALSLPVLLPEDAPGRALGDHRHTPIFLSHTANDDVIDITLGKEMRDTLTEGGVHSVVWKEYETGGHWIPEPEGFDDVVDFLSKSLRLHREPFKYE